MGNEKQEMRKEKREKKWEEILGDRINKREEKRDILMLCT